MWYSLGTSFLAQEERWTPQRLPEGKKWIQTHKVCLKTHVFLPSFFGGLKFPHKIDLESGKCGCLKASVRWSCSVLHSKGDGICVPCLCLPALPPAWTLVGPPVPVLLPGAPLLPSQHSPELCGTHSPVSPSQTERFWRE